MKSGVLSVVLFVSVAALSVSQASAAPPAPAVEVDPAVAATSSEALVCNASQAFAQKLAGPSPTPATEVCGTCGQDLCDNRNVGAACYHPGQGLWGWCIPPWGGTCVDGRANCQCATEYQ